MIKATLYNHKHILLIKKQYENLKGRFKYNKKHLHHDQPNKHQCLFKQNVWMATDQYQENISRRQQHELWTTTDYFH